MDGNYGWASGEMRIAADVDPYEQEIMQLKKKLKDTEAHRDGLSLALKDLREAVLPMLSVEDIVRSTEFAGVFNATGYNGCCTSCDRCFCIDAHPSCSCVDCGGTGYYKGNSNSG